MEKAINSINLLKAQGFFVLIYAGIFIPERQLDKIIEACSNLKKVKLVFVGRNSYYLEELKKKYEDGFTYLGFFSPPDHLKIIESADIGILTYVAQNGSINAVFCAPNKIFEYGSCGLPVIGNDIPGLSQVIEKENIGACFIQDDVESIEFAIKDVINNYSVYSQNIFRFVNSIDVDAEIDKVLKNYKNYAK